MGSKAKLAVGLDLGSSSTRVVICALENESLRFLGHGEAPSHAWNRGRLSDQGALTQSIRFALHEAESRAQASPESAVIGLGGSVAFHVGGFVAGVTISRPMKRRKLFWLLPS